MFAEVPTTIKTGDWPDLPKEFPDFEVDAELPPKRTWTERNMDLAEKMRDWRSDRIGGLSKAEIFYNGLSPVDFMRAFHDKYELAEQVDDLLALDAEADTSKLFYTKMGLHQDHINNIFSDAELENLCYERGGSKRWYADRLAKKLDCNGQIIPVEILDAIQECNLQMSLGRSSFRNYMRRINKENKAQQLTVMSKVKKKKGKKKNGMLTVKRGGAVVKFS
tara:strand:- start:2446 stop:3108 length:663 start_codon:yes stop_codon:yes gene_type:complete